MDTLIQFELELNSISIKDGWGKEITLSWKFDDFDEGEKFYTDSNGLEMQPRQLNKRFSYPIDTTNH